MKSFKKRLVAYLLTFVMVFTYSPGFTMAYAGDADSISTTGLDGVLTPGESQDFSVVVDLDDNSENEMKASKFIFECANKYISNPDVRYTIEYLRYDDAGQKNWQPLEDNCYTGSDGILLQDSTHECFRITFQDPGTYELTVSAKDKDNSDVIYVTSEKQEIKVGTPVTYDPGDGVGTAYTCYEAPEANSNLVKPIAKSPDDEKLNFSKEGYVFDYWKYGTNKINAGAQFDLIFTGGTLVAQWKEAPKYKVTYSAGEGAGAVPDDQEYQAGTEVTVAPADGLSKEGADFKGWQRSDTNEIVAPEATFAMPEEDITLTAQWNKVYTVTYSAGTGTGDLPDTAKYSENEAVTPGTMANLDEYDFAGWKRSDNGVIVNEAFNMPAMNIVLTAQWAKKGETYSVTYKAGEGTGEAVEEKDIKALAAVTAKAADTFTAPEGKHFAGWERSDNSATVAAGGSFNMPAMNIVLTAKWDADAKAYDVKYAKGGDANADLTGIENETDVKAGDMVTVADAPATTSGKIFTGWRNSADQMIYQAGDSFTMPAVNVTLTAQWTNSEEKFTVNYALNGGTGEYAPVTDINSKDIVTIKSEEPVKEKSVFIGWMRSDNGQILGAGDAFNMPAMNVTLTAQWEQKDVVAPTVTTDIASKKIVAGNEAEFTVTTKANDLAGKMSMGWFEFSNPNAIEKLEYLESRDGQWYELPGAFFGPVETGFPLIDGTSKFRVTFKEAGTYDVKISVEEFAAGPTESTVLCSVEKTITVGGESYTVKYLGNGETSGTMEEVTVESSKPYTIAANEYAKSVDGIDYTFVGWCAAADGHGKYYQVGDEINVIGNMTLYAQWLDINDYTLTYDKNAPEGKTVTGSVPAESKGKAGAEFKIGAGTIAIDADENEYVMTGWNTKADGSGEFYSVGDTFTIGNADVTLYAQWQTVAKTEAYVAYDPNGGNKAPVDNNNPYEKGQKAIALGAGEMYKEGFEFTGWNTAANGSGTDYAAGEEIAFENAGKITLYAQWEAVTTYSVTYDANGGEGGIPVDSKKYEEGDLVTLSDAPMLYKDADIDAKENYVFDGWLVEGNDTVYAPGSTYAMETSNVTFKAHWRAIPMDEYAVIYNLAGGTGSIVDDATYIAGAMVTVAGEVPTREGYVFDGWGYMTADGKTYHAGEEIAMPEGGLYLVAQWTAVYTVTYDADGGSAVTDENEYKLGDTVIVAAASEKENYVFEGWLDKSSNTEYGAGTQFPMPGKNLVLTAQWSKIYTVKFSLGDDYVGTETAPADQTVTLGECLTSVGTPANYTKDAVEYYFAGWYNQNDDLWDFSKPVDAGCFTADGVMTLTAKWDQTQQYNVIFDDNLDTWYDEYVTVNGAADEDGQYTSNDLSFIGSDKKINQAYIPEYARVDYTFTGWYLDKACKAEFYLDDTLADNNVDNRSKPVKNDDGTYTFVLYAGWEANYDTPDDVTIYTDELEDGTYGLYFSQFIDAYDNTASNIPVYRNYVLVNADTGKTVNATTLPEGLYLNSRTGEIYGVPTVAGEYEFTVRMRDDAGKNWISEPQTIAVTINQMPYNIDHSALDGAIFDKTYGDREEKALNMNDEAEGRTYYSRNLEVKVNGVLFKLKTNKKLVALDNFSNMVLNVSQENQTVDMTYSYETAAADREARPAFDPADRDTLRNNKDLADPINFNEYKINDLATVPYVREEGEDAGKYKLSVQNDDITIVTKDSEESVKANYNDDIVADGFKVKNMAEDTDAKYVFTINPAEFTIDIPAGSDYRKTYGETDQLFADKLDITDILNAAETTTPVASGTDKTVTIEFANGIVDTMTLAYSRNTLLEDAGQYKLYLVPDSITGISINSVTKEAEDVAAKLANNYDINIVDAFQALSGTGVDAKYIYNIDTRDAGAFIPDEATVEYGTLLKDGDVTGTIAKVAGNDESGLADNEEIKVVDKVTAKVADTAANISTGGYLNAKTSYAVADKALSFTMNNTKFVEDAEDNTTASDVTTANYTENTPVYTLTVTQKAITLSPSTVKVTKDATPVTADAIKGLVSVSGILTGDVVNENDILRFSYTNANNEAKVNMTAAEAAADLQAVADAADENGTVTVSVTLDLTCSDAGVDAPNYTVSPVDATVEITVIPPTPLTINAGSKSATVGSTPLNADGVKALFSLTGTKSPDTAAIDFTKVKFNVNGTEYATAEDVAAALSTEQAQKYTIKLIATAANAFTSTGDGVYSLAADAEATATYTVNAAGGGGGGGGGGGAVVPPVLITDDHFAYMQGNGNGFNPEANMTRAEAATVFYNLLNDKKMGRAITSFSDVQEGDWYYTAVMTLTSKGIITGYSDGTYNPSGNITRAEFAALASRFGELDGGTCSFSDVNVDYWAYKYIASAVSKGWITGYTDNTFRPENNIKRAEVATLVNRVLERVPDEKYIKANIDKINVPADVSKDHWAFYQIIEATNGHNYKKADAKSVEQWSSLK